MWGVGGVKVASYFLSPGSRNVTAIIIGDDDHIVCIDRSTPWIPNATADDDDDVLVIDNNEHVKI